MAITIIEGLTFDDVLLVPRHSDISSRADVDLSVKLSKGLEFKHPIVPANMKTVTGYEMAGEIYKSGGMAILHRFMPVEEQLQIAESYSKNPEKLKFIGFSVGVKEKDYEIVDKFSDFGVKILCVDVAHGHSKLAINMVKYISEKHPNIFLIAGNVATGLGAKHLWLAGADAVKVGVGPGSLCTTRIETGNGVPQLTALSDVFDMKGRLISPHREYMDKDGHWELYKEPGLDHQIYIIADGGIKNAGDMVKALCFADMVMAGNIFAGADETPGEKLLVNGKQFKRYDGSSTHKSNHIEGVTSLVPTKGKTINILSTLFDGIRSGLSYQGSDNLTKLKQYPQFVKITNAGLKESHPHDVLVIK